MFWDVGSCGAQHVDEVKNLLCFPHNKDKLT